MVLLTWELAEEWSRRKGESVKIKAKEAKTLTVAYESQTF